MAGLEYGCGFDKMNEKNLNTPYTSRTPISRKAFAVRHMFLEEIKFRHFELPFNAKTEEKDLLEKLAQELFVEITTSGYQIMLNGVVVTQVAKEDLDLFVRGDTPDSMDQQEKQHLFTENEADKVLTKNNNQVTKLVDTLLEYLLQKITHK